MRSEHAIFICLGSLRGELVMLLTIIVNVWSGITLLSPLVHKTGCLRAVPLCCKMSHIPDAEVRTRTVTSDIGGITARLHTCTFYFYASSGDSNVHTGESNVSNRAMMRLSISFIQRALH